MLIDCQMVCGSKLFASCFVDDRIMIMRKNQRTKSALGYKNLGLEVEKKEEN